MYGNAVVGIDPTSSGVNAYQATITSGGNLISGNGGAGVRILGDDNVVAWNLIGTTITGAATLANGGDGVRLEAGATGNLVGHADPVTSIDYFNTSEITADTSLPVTSWTGIRGLDNGDYLITGSTESGGVQSGLLYVGPLDGGDGDAYAINYPGGTGTATSVYGPDDLGDGEVLLVGTYVLDGDETRYGFAFRGNLATMATDVTDPTNYETIWNGSAVQLPPQHDGRAGGRQRHRPPTPGNRSRPGLHLRLRHRAVHRHRLPGHDFQHRLRHLGQRRRELHDRRRLLAAAGQQRRRPRCSRSAWPRWSTTTVLTGTFSNWRAYSYQSPDQVTAATHFMGISSVEKGVYTLSGSGFVSGEIVSSGLATVVRADRRLVRRHGLGRISPRRNRPRA